MDYMAKKKDILVEIAQPKKQNRGGHGVIGNKGNPNPPAKFPEGNQFWQLRAKHGRERIIQDAQVLAQTASDYFQHCIDNPIIVIDYKGKENELVEYPKPRAFQRVGFLKFCRISNWSVLENLKKVSNDFLTVIEEIEKTIYEQKFEHAAVGIFNANLIARDLNLADVTESTVKLEGGIDVSKLTEDQLDAIRNAR